MQTELVPEVPPETANVLIAHLRQNPRDVRRDPRELGTSLGVDPAFVAHVLDAVVAGPRKEEAPPLQISLRPLLDSARSAVHRFDRLIIHPRRFILVTTVLCVLVGWLLQFVTRQIGLEAMPSGARISLGSATIAILATLAVHMALFFRKGMSRYAVFGAGVVGAVLMALMLPNLWNATADKPQRLALLLMTSFGIGMMSLMYASVGSLCAVLGGWYRFRRRDVFEERMTRQDLLERYFELQARLQMGTSSGTHARPWQEWPIVQFVRRYPLASAAIGGALMALVQVLVTGPTHLHAPPSSPAEDPGLLLLTSVLGVMTSLTHVALGFLASTPRRAAAASAFFSLAGLAPYTLPIGRYGLDYVRNPEVLSQAVVTGSVMATVAVIAAIGATVQKRFEHESNLQRNDQASLAAEMLRLQWRLSDGATNVCVMVVDVARSSEMKATADPLTVEYSFREYQEWIAERSEERGGRVHSTAGDGSVVAFESCAEAFAAARRIQTNLPRFNAHVNRLTTPFRVRIGLHVGHVAGELDEVQFTDVIDIAAHIQAAAPVGGIAASERVAQALGDEEFVPLARSIDGHNVFLALNPVDD